MTRFELATLTFAKKVRMTVRAVRPVPCSTPQSAKPSVGPVEFVYRYTITRSIVSACVPDDCMAAADHLGDGPVLDQPRADHDRVRRYRTNRTASTAPRESGIGVMFSDTVASGAARPTPNPLCVKDFFSSCFWARLFDRSCRLS